MATQDNTYNESSSEDVVYNDVSNINIDALSILNSTTSLADERPDYVRDNSWVKQSFIARNLDVIDVRNRGFSSAAFKYTDSSVGGNFCINPPPQFTPYADLRDKGIMPSSVDTTLSYRPGHTGMGRYYSEAIDDHNQIVHLSFGVPAYNSLISFFTGFYNSSAAGLARTGRFEDSFIQKLLKFGVGVVQAALLPVLIFPIALTYAGMMVKFLMRIPSSKFAYLKRAMPMYWTVVSTMLNQIAVNRGVMQSGTEFSSRVIGTPAVTSGGQNSIYSSIMPNEFMDNGLLNVYAIATKTKRLEARHRTALIKAIESGSDHDWFGVMSNVYGADSGLMQAGNNEIAARGLSGFWQLWTKVQALGQAVGSSVEKDLREGKDVSGMDAATAEALLKDQEFKPVNDAASFMEFFLASADDGADYASFRVDYAGPVQESFQNTTAPSALADKINSASKSARDLKIDMAGGNLDPTGLVKGAMDAVGTVVSGLADTFYLSGLAVFAGNALVDIPEHWDSHVASLPSSTYTIELRSPYGNHVSQMINLYLPLCMLLAGALPLSTGKQSYQSPFMCELHDRGRRIIKFGVIDSLTIQRGTGNMGFNDQGQAMGIDVSFSVKDLSSVVAMPIQQGGSVMPLEGLFDMDNTFTDYMAAISGISVRENYDRFPIMMRQWKLKKANALTYWSKARMAQATSDFAGLGTIISTILNSPGNTLGQRGIKQY